MKSTEVCIKTKSTPRFYSKIRILKDNYTMDYQCIIFSLFKLIKAIICLFDYFVYHSVVYSFKGNLNYIEIN